MRLATVSAGGAIRFGAIVEGGFVDLLGRLSVRCPDLPTFLAAGLREEAARVCANAPIDFRLHELSFLPVNARRDARMFALGVAYKDHQLETGRSDTEFPSLFSKHPQALVGHGHALLRPRISTQFDFEGEVVVVIGKAGRNIGEGVALEHVGGYSILVDGSVRDYQKHSVTAGKNFDSSSAYGPWMVTADEIADWREMVLTTRLNGEQMQHSAFGMLIWSLPFVINYVSRFTRLEPGDAISTGTPAGVGHRRNPQLFMKAGDVLEVEVTGIGTLRNPIAEE
jgi:2-keto-4-pentenoate hydratase/2-oxohepta-3-ene-1,7-dioic acid hydratase in catechol pathway